MGVTFRKLLYSIVIAAIALSSGFQVFDLRGAGSAAAQMSKAKKSAARKATKKRTKLDVTKRPGQCGTYKYYDQKSRQCVDKRGETKRLEVPDIMGCSDPEDCEPDPCTGDDCEDVGGRGSDMGRKRSLRKKAR